MLPYTISNSWMIIIIEGLPGSVRWRTLSTGKYEKCEDITGVTRRRNLNRRKHIDQEKKDRKTNNDQKNIS
jgi:hypothetical protein